MRPFQASDVTAVTALRVLAIDQVEAANSGHPGLPLGAAPMVWVLWSRFLKHDPAAPDWPDRDRFVLSAGHGSALLYALLHLFGYPLPLEELRRFRQWGSRTPGHPEFGLTRGVETTTGPLGQGLANAVGMALAERHLAVRFNRDGWSFVDHRTWVLASDGDLQEGVAHEAAALAGHLKLGRLVVLWDDNRITIEGNTALAWSEDVPARFRALGWRTYEVEDGNDLAAIAAALEAASGSEDAPALVRVRTEIGFGSPHKQGSAEAHGAPLGPEEARLTKRALGWTSDEPFAVPSEVYRWASNCAAAGAAAHRAWRELAARWEAAYPELAAEWQRRLTGSLPAGWEDALPSFADSKAMATRQASGIVLNAVAPLLPELMGGSADLAPSNNSRIAGEDSIQPGLWGGRNLHFGVREHAMAAICNGLSLHGGIRPYAATFLIFADYLRPALRLSALMHRPVIYIFTHDSVVVGEDGPTHQPVEHLAALRAIPNLVVLRPADAHETREAWRVALKRREGPTALVLTRQKLPALPAPPAGATARGAFVRAEASQGAPEVVILATGSEVALALEVRRRLEEATFPTRVVSLPSWELFAAQEKEYQSLTLGPRGCLRVALEMGRGQGWERWVGSGIVLSIERFGASAPGEEVAHRLGFSAEQVAQRIQLALARVRSALGRKNVPMSLAGAMAGKHARLASLHIVPRIATRDPSLWIKGLARTAGAPLGWLDLPCRSRRQLPRIQALVAGLVAEGVRTLYLLGLGPASLAPWALRHTCGTPAGRELEVVDTIDPWRLSTLLDTFTPSHSALLVLAPDGAAEDETLALLELFWQRLASDLGERAGARVLAVGVHGSNLERLASARGFAAFLPHPVDATLRFGAYGPAPVLSAAWLGLDAEQFLASGERAFELSPAHPAAELAALLSSVAESGWGRLEWCPSPGLLPFGVYVEQLLAGATGRGGRGILTLLRAVPPAPGEVDPHTLVLSPRWEGEDTGSLDAALNALGDAGHPVVGWQLPRHDLGEAFATWELTAALTALLIGVNPFLESPPLPRRRLTPSARRRPAPRAPARWNTLATHLASAPGLAGVVLLAYLPERREVWQELMGLAKRLERHVKAPVTFGFAPRAALALGPLLTQGPETLLPVVLTADHAQPFAIPGRRDTLTRLGEVCTGKFLATAAAWGRRPLWLHLGDDPASALAALAPKGE